MNYFLKQLLVIAVLVVGGCGDPCDGVVCGLGTCDDGTCICLDGYEGTSCETLENERHFGLYNVIAGDCGIGAGVTITSMNLEALTGGEPYAVNIIFTQYGNESHFDGLLKNGKLTATTALYDLKGDFSNPNTFTVILSWGEVYFCNITFVK